MYQLAHSRRVFRLELPSVGLPKDEVCRRICAAQNIEGVVELVDAVTGVPLGDVVSRHANILVKFTMDALAVAAEVTDAAKKVPTTLAAADAAKKVPTSNVRAPKRMREQLVEPVMDVSELPTYGVEGGEDDDAKRPTYAVHENFVCHICGAVGVHRPKQCPLARDITVKPTKKNLGLPAGLLTDVAGDEVEGALPTLEGTYLPNRERFKERSALAGGRTYQRRAVVVAALSKSEDAVEQQPPCDWTETDPDFCGSVFDM